MVSQSLLVTSNVDHDTINISIILDILRDRLFHLIENQNSEMKDKYINLFIESFLPIILPFLVSENLEQRINIFNEIDKILNDSRFDDDFKKYFALFLISNEENHHNKYSIFKNLKYHKEYKKAISSIFNCLSLHETKNLNCEMIEKLWINNQNLSSSDLFSFFQLFFSLANHDKNGNILTSIIDCVLNHSEFTDQNVFEWFDKIDIIIQNLESRHTSAKLQIDMVRQILWSISFQISSSPLSNFIDKNSHIIERARKSLAKIINVEPDENDFSQIIEMLKNNNDPFLYTLLNEFLKDPQLPISEEEIQSMINQTLNQLMDYFSDPNSDFILKSKIYNFFLCLCKFSNSSFNDDQIDKLCSLQDVIPDFFSLLLHLSYSNTISEFDLEKIINRINPNSVNKTFFRFVKKIIVEVNSTLFSNIRFLPLKHENTLWHFATTNTKIRYFASKFLCKLYSLNDGKELDDKKMIDTFLEHWLVFYSNDPDDDQLLDLIKIFIETIELQTFHDQSIPLPHQYTELDIFVKVHSPDTEISLTVPFSAKAGMIIEKVSLEMKIDMNSFDLLFKEKPLKRSDYLKKYITGTDSKSNEINLDFSRKNADSNPCYHKRTSLPSIIFINNPMMPIQEIFKKVEDGNKKAFDLVQLLPTLSFAPDFSNPEKAAFFMGDHKVFFDTSKPLIFFYNLETLLHQNQISIICQNYDFLNYLYYNINNLFESMKATNLKDDELIILIIIFLKKAFVISDRDSQKQFFYLFAKCAIEMTNLSRSIQLINQFFQQTNARSTRINFPEDDFEEMFKYLILNSNEKVRKNSMLLFNYLNIPLSIFLQIIDEYKNNISVEFLLLLNDHFNDDRTDITNENLSDTILLLIDDNANGQFLNALLLIVIKLIKHEIIDEANKLNILVFLIKKFLILDFNEDDRIAFNNASECLSNLSCIRHSTSTQIKNENTKMILLCNQEILDLAYNKDNCCSNKLILKEVLNIHHDQNFFVDTIFTHYMINGDESSISLYNKVGLKNIGMTCYMNAIFQQFYAIKALRYSIMSYSDNHPLLSSITHLFFLMKYVKRKFIDPTFVVEKWEMRPNIYLNPRIQQDAAEILQFLLRTFEVGTETKKTTDDLFEGEFSHLIEGIDFEYQSETKETFSVIELEVQNCKDLMESFRNFSKPELFLNDSQYYAEELGVRINAKRSTFIQKAPPILIIHLMRFYYNYSKNERIKITNPFSIPSQIDISSVCIDKSQDNLVYSLIGVIVHIGTATDGHYISFVYNKNKKTWLCFNDENVTQVTKQEVIDQASGSKPSSTGYILFYEKVDHDSDGIEKVKPPKNIQTEIDQINNENLKARLMCSSGYFDLMKSLCLETSMNYFDVCLKYTSDTLPFIRVSAMSEKYFSALKDKLKGSELSTKEEFVDFVLNPRTKYANEALFYCPYKEVRLNFADLLLSIYDPRMSRPDPIPVCDCLFQLVDDFWSNYQHADNFLKVLYELYKKFESVKKFAAENCWYDKLCDVFGSKFDSFQKEKPTLKVSYIFEGMNLTHYLKLIDSLSTESTTELSKYLMNDSFLLNACLSDSSVCSIARFARKYLIDEEQIISFVEKNLSKLKPFRAISLMYLINPRKATFDLFNSHLATATNRELNSSDIIVILIATVNSLNDAKDALIKVAENWLPYFLFDENIETRSLCLSLCAFLAPCNLFDSSLYEIKNVPDDLEIPCINGIEKFHEISEVFIKDSFKKFLDVAFNSVGLLNNRICDFNVNKTQFNGGYESSIGDEFADQFLSLVSVLLQVAQPDNDDFSPIFSLYETLTKSSFNPFNEQSQKVLMLIFKFKMHIIVDDLIIPFMRDEILDLIREQEELIYFSLEQFLPPFLCVLTEIEQCHEISYLHLSRNKKEDENRTPLLLIPDHFFDIFFRVIVFQSIPYLSKVVNNISSFLQNEISKRESVGKSLVSMIDEYFDSLIENNFWGLCLALNAVNEKRPGITDLLPDHMEELKNSGSDINMMVQIAITSSLSQSIDKKKLDEMINKFDFNEKSMKMLLSLTYI